MKKLKAIAAFLLILSSCESEKFDEGQMDKEITMSFEMSGPAVKSGYDAQKGSFVWDEGDRVGIFCDADVINRPVAVSDTREKMVFPGKTSRIYGVFPYSESDVNGPSEVSVSIPSSYTQSRGGMFDVDTYPMWAASDVHGTQDVHLSFSPLVTVLALNIYKTQANVDDEKIIRVQVMPSSNTGFTGTGVVDLTASVPALKVCDGKSSFSEVILGTPCEIAVGAPKNLDEKKKFATQIYVPLARQNYSNVKFWITTNYGTYEIASPDGALFNGTSCDLILTGINLTGKFVTVENASFNDPVNVPGESVTVDRLPDFSRVGYHYGETPLPTVPVAAEISPASVAANLAVNGGAYADTTAYIQSVIDRVGQNGGGAVLLKNGTYNIGSTLFIDRSNVVLRGESEEGTIIKAVGRQPRAVIFMGTTVAAGEGDIDVNGREIGYSEKQLSDPVTDEYYTTRILMPSSTGWIRGRGTMISEDYVPLGRLYVEVDDASLFSVGDLIEIFRPATLPWISAIHMDKIADVGRTVQWSERMTDLDLKYVRKVTSIRGNRVYFDSPLVMALDRQYTDSYVYKVSWNMTRETGVEYLTIDSEYDPSLVQGPSSYFELMEPVDEMHAWYGVCIASCEHSWVRNVTTRHMAVSAVCARRGMYITVKDCKSYDPASYVSGGRRYAFYIVGGQMCLFSGCVCEHDRHAYVTSATEGPNVFYDCKATTNYNDLGPHHNWSTGMLYDNVYTDGWLYVRDRGKSGDGHGWAGANHVFWNCDVANYHGVIGQGRLICQSPWASAKNYCVGCRGYEYSFHEERVYHGGGWDGTVGDVFDWCRANIPGYDGRPHGEWYPERPKGQNITGGEKVYLPDADAAAKYSWWPELSKTSYSNNHSLYLTQLEDRLSRGIFLSNQ